MIYVKVGAPSYSAVGMNWHQSPDEAPACMEGTVAMNGAVLLHFGCL